MRTMNITTSMEACKPESVQTLDPVQAGNLVNVSRFHKIIPPRKPRSFLILTNIQRTVPKEDSRLPSLSCEAFYFRVRWYEKNHDFPEATEKVSVLGNTEM